MSRVVSAPALKDVRSKDHDGRVGGHCKPHGRAYQSSSVSKPKPVNHREPFALRPTHAEDIKRRVPGLVVGCRVRKGPCDIVQCTRGHVDKTWIKPIGWVYNITFFDSASMQGKKGVSDRSRGYPVVDVIHFCHSPQATPLKGWQAIMSALQSTQA